MEDRRAGGCSAVVLFLQKHSVLLSSQAGCTQTVGAVLMTLKAAPTFRGQTTWELELGRVQTESKSKLVNRNENKQGADWCLLQKRSPSFLVSEKINDLQPNAKIKKLSKNWALKIDKQIENTNSNSSFSVSYWSAHPRQNVTSGLPYTAHNPELARQRSRSDAR